MEQVNILVLYWTKNGTTLEMARAVARGVDGVDNAAAVLRVAASDGDGDSGNGPPPVSHDDFRQCAGLIVGSPAHFGNMAAPLKRVFDETTPLWVSGTLCGKPAGVFTSAGSMHGGHETTLLSMMMPLLHHGMLICSLPCTETALINTQGGGTPYGPSHYSGKDNSRAGRRLSEDEIKLCRLLGERVARTAVALSR